MGPELIGTPLAEAKMLQFARVERRPPAPEASRSVSSDAACTVIMVEVGVRFLDCVGPGLRRR